MEQSEVELLVGELETRIDRLRSLYDMYFMGIERLEPLVPKKDVERRLAQLRKEQIRNTGLRFKFQQIIQRYNTYQTYWLRIARQIEQGTYRRDVMRAQARFGVDPMRERATDEAPEREEVPESAPEAEVPSRPVEEVYDLGAFAEEIGELEADPFAGISEPPAPATAARALGTRDRFASASRFELDELADDPFEEADPFPKPAGIRIAPRPGAAVGGGSLRAPAPVGASLRPLASADQGPGTMPGVQPGQPRVMVAKRASIPDEGERQAKAPPAMGTAPGVPGVPGAQRPAPGPVVMPVVRQSGPAAMQTTPGVQRPQTAPGIVPVVRAGPTIQAAPGGPGASSAAPAAASKPPVPAAASTGAPKVIAGPSAASTAPAVVSRAPLGAPVVPSRAPAASAPAITVKPAVTPSRAPGGGPGTAPAAAIATAALAGSTPAAASVPVRPPPAASRAPAPPPARPVVSAPPAARPAPPPAPSPVGDLSGERFGEIFSQYVTTRQKHNEPTSAITRDALAKQLRESTARLKERHGSKAIDFEVVVKDGKTILRPVVK